MLQKHKKHLATLLRKKIMIKFLMLAPENAVKMGTEYMSVSPQTSSSNRGAKTHAKIIDEYRSSLNALRELCNSRNSGYLEIRQTNLPLSASYVAVDLPDVCYDNSHKVPHRQPIIQMMVYQFAVLSENSPITYLTPQKYPAQFKSTRVYLKTPNAPGQRTFSRCAAPFFLEIRQYSCEKMSCSAQKFLAAGHIGSFQIHPRYSIQEMWSSAELIDFDKCEEELSEIAEEAC